MSSGRTIDYEALAQEAMRGVVRAVLTQAAKSGLPGDHHFYLSFDTRAPNVTMSRRLKERYPEEMTIVLQHRFWDLIVADDRFEVKLTFDGIPERLVVPFKAIRVFFDPSVRYGLQFGDSDMLPGSEGEGASNATRTAPTGGDGPIDFDRSSKAAGAGGRGSRSVTERKPRATTRSKSRADQRGGDDPSHIALADTSTPSGGEPAAADAGDKGEGEAKRPAPGSRPALVTDGAGKPSEGAQIVRLDTFRKK